MTPDFYRQFEHHFRGSRSAIKERLAFYQPFLKCLHATINQRSALDLGCGRGEWLEILIQTGFDAQGVDLDEGMLQACHAIGLSAKHADALQTLKSFDDNSLALVSAIHVIEHIPFAQLIDLVKEAHRALAPGGLLILETPNSENLYSTTTSFYLDPTHTKPIPRALLSFVVEFGGFKTHKIVGLNENCAQQHGKATSLTNVMFGASPDYAVIAIKITEPDQITPYEPLLKRDYGVSLLELSKQYDQSISAVAPIARLENALGIVSDGFFATGCKLDDTYDLAEQHAQAISQQREVINQHAEAISQQREVINQHAQAISQQREVSEQHAQAISQQREVSEQQLRSLEGLEDRISQLDLSLLGLQGEIERTHQIQAGLVKQIDSMHNSTSWRITRPMRAVGRIAKSVKHHGLKGFFLPVPDYVHSSPARRANAAKWLKRLGLRKAAARLEHTESDSC